MEYHKYWAFEWDKEKLRVKIFDAIGSLYLLIYCNWILIITLSLGMYLLYRAFFYFDIILGIVGMFFVTFGGMVHARRSIGVI